MRTVQTILAAALTAGLEMSGFVPFQPPTNPPDPMPRKNPTPLPTPQTPRSQPPAQLPTPQVPTYTPTNPNPTTPSTPNGTNPNGTNPNGTNPTGVDPNGTNTASARALRPFAFQSPQMEARFTETTRRLAQMETRLEQSNQDLLRRLGEARQLSGERQNAALMDVFQQFLQNNAEMQRYLVQSRLGWTGGSDDSTLPNQNPQTAVPDDTTQR